jgi:hypothetical protein
VARHQQVKLGWQRGKVDLNVDARRLAAGERGLDRRPQVLDARYVLRMATERRRNVVIASIGEACPGDVIGP